MHSKPGGALAIPSWGKFWLALIDLYGYEGLNPFLPEFFVLPEWLPFHPSKYYCHTRYIYLAVAYLYGSRFRGRLGPILHDLRRELYAAPYEQLDFAGHRHDIAATDLYVRPSALLRLVYDAASLYERHHAAGLRRQALEALFERILYEQRTSRYQGLSPVNGLLNCLAQSWLGTRTIPSWLRALRAWKAGAGKTPPLEFALPEPALTHGIPPSPCRHSWRGRSCQRR